MGKIIITVESNDEEMANTVVDLLKNNPYKNYSDLLDIVSEYQQPVSKPCLNYTLNSKTNLKYQMDDNSNLEEFHTLMHFATDYTEFAKKVMADNEALEEDSDSFSFDFFSEKSSSDYKNSNINDNQSYNDSKYYFAAGLGLCIASGILFAFAPTALATLVLIVAIVLIGMCYCNRDQETNDHDNYCNFLSSTI